MNSSYNNRLKKNKIIPQDNNQKVKRLFPLGHYINNGKKLNSYSGYNKEEIKNKVLNEYSNPIVNTYNPPDSYYNNYQNNKISNILYCLMAYLFQMLSKWNFQSLGEKTSYFNVIGELDSRCLIQA